MHKHLAPSPRRPNTGFLVWSCRRASPTISVAIARASSSGLASTAVRPPGPECRETGALATIGARNLAEVGSWPGTTLASHSPMRLLRMTLGSLIALASLLSRNRARPSRRCISCRRQRHRRRARSVADRHAPREQVRASVQRGGAERENSERQIVGQSWGRMRVANSLRLRSIFWPWVCQMASSRRPRSRRRSEASSAVSTWRWKMEWSRRGAFMHRAPRQRGCAR